MLTRAGYPRAVAIWAVLALGSAWGAPPLASGHCQRVGGGCHSLAPAAQRSFSGVLRQGRLLALQQRQNHLTPWHQRVGPPRLVTLRFLGTDGNRAPSEPLGPREVGSHVVVVTLVLRMAGLPTTALHGIRRTWPPGLYCHDPCLSPQPWSLI